MHFDTFNDYYDPFYDFVPLRGVFRFGSARHLGEDPNGVWKLRVTDRIHVVDGAFQGWNVIVYGHAPTPDAPTVESVTPGAGSLAVAWTAPVPTTGSEVTAYDLRHIPTDADKTVESNWTVVEEVWDSRRRRPGVRGHGADGRHRVRRAATGDQRVGRRRLVCSHVRDPAERPAHVQ